MDDNVKDLVNTLYQQTCRISELVSQLAVLRRLIDKEDTNFEKSDHEFRVSALIYTDVIRMIFGWGLCDAAKNARIEREAEKAAKNA